MTKQTEQYNADLEAVPAVDDVAAGADVLREKLTDIATPGYQVEFDPDEADQAGAFHEDALSEGDALGSTDDLAALDGDSSLQLVFLDDAPLSDELPAFVNTTTAKELFGLLPGESVAQAAARKVQEG